MTDEQSENEKAPKRRRNPERTREAILEVAGKLLGRDGPEGVSVSQVAQLAGVNRGTAYHHFQTREQLLNETTAWVSDKLCKEVFGEVPLGAAAEDRLEPQTVTERLARFAMENPEFGRVWLFDVLGSSEPTKDPFWNHFKASVDNFVDSEYAVPGIDSEVHAVLMLVGVFLWPVWARAHTSTEKERAKMTKRFSEEVMRMNLNGTMQKDKFDELISSVAGRKKA